MIKYSILKQNQGIALILTILLMSLILFLSLYLLAFALTESRIAKSQSWGAKTYYLAEAGVQEMVWKLKNDTAYKQGFETNPGWSASFTRANPFGVDNGSYTVSIANSALAHGLITSTGTIDIGSGKTSQRIVKTYVYRAMGQSGLDDNCGYADGNINISFSAVNFHDGSAFSNNNFTINGLSTVNIDADLNAVNQYDESPSSEVNVGGAIHAANRPPAPAPIQMPALDFDSADPNSLKNRATVVYTQSQFDTLMANNQNLTLPAPITYVDGDVELKGAQNLTVNGELVVGRDLIIGKNLCRGLFRCGNSSLTINHTAGQAAGVLAKRKIIFEAWSGAINVDGIIYANDQLNLLGLPLGLSFNANGGLIARKLTLISAWRSINIYYNNTILTEALGTSELSPVIAVEHWEEEY
jgi:Tfp pilus assembly protein PilX